MENIKFDHLFSRWCNWYCLAKQNSSTQLFRTDLIAVAIPENKVFWNLNIEWKNFFVQKDFGTVLWRKKNSHIGIENTKSS